MTLVDSLFWRILTKLFQLGTPTKTSREMVLLRIEQINWLLVMVTLLSILPIGISAAINTSDNRSVGNTMDISTLVPYGYIIKDNIWFIIMITCIIGSFSLIFVMLSFFIGPGIFRDKIRFLRSKVAETERAVRRGKYYRHEMINQVRNIWIKGFLADSLNNIVTMELGLDECRNRIGLRGNLVVQPPIGLPRQLPSSSRIIEVFDELGGSFLILGKPGSGKTILLLQLARELLDRAKGDDRHPIPVVFHLSTWTVQRPHLADWLVDELAIRYNVSRGLGGKWVNEDNILPLLDGLDEVSKEHRGACVEEINKFREQHGLLPLVVCSRMEEYDELKLLLKLPTTIIIKPLNRPQIEQYLKSIGAPMEGVQVALQDDPVLWELIETPLMLNIVTLAFKGKSAESVRGTGELNERRSQVFDAYKQAMFDRPGRSIITRYTPHQVEHWLSWLANSMIKHNQNTFYMELMQPYWLPSLWLQRVLAMETVLILGLAFGVLYGLSDRMGIMLGYGLFDSLGGGLSYGLFTGFSYWIVMSTFFSKIRAERLHFVASTRLVFWLVISLVFGLIAGLAGSQLGGLIGGLAGSRLSGLTSGIGCGLILLVMFSIEQKELDVRKYPNEGTHSAAKNALTMGLLSGLIGGLIAGLVRGLAFGPTADLVHGLALGLVLGLVIGLIGGLVFGGYVCIQHYLLRIILRIYNLTPMNYVKFLDYATDRIFLRKVGGGYVFIHRIIMEYFASLEPDNSAALTQYLPPS